MSQGLPQTSTKGGQTTPADAARIGGVDPGPAGHINVVVVDAGVGEPGETLLADVANSNGRRPRASGRSRGSDTYGLAYEI
jgi:hypothetical protein